MIKRIFGSALLLLLVACLVVLAVVGCGSDIGATGGTVTARVPARSPLRDARIAVTVRRDGVDMLAVGAVEDDAAGTVLVGGVASIVSYAWDSVGRRLGVSDSDGHVFVVTYPDLRVNQVAALAGRASKVFGWVARDDVILVGSDDRNGPSLFLVAADGTGSRRLAVQPDTLAPQPGRPTLITAAAPSPASPKIAYVWSQFDNEDLRNDQASRLVLETEPDSRPKRIMSGTLPVEVGWSPDGSMLALTSACVTSPLVWRDPQIFLATEYDGCRVVVLPSGKTSPELWPSSDGDPDRPLVIYAINIDTGAATAIRAMPLTIEAVFVGATPDGSAFIEFDGATDELRVLPVETNAPTRVAGVRLPPNTTFGGTAKIAFGRPD